MVYFEDVHLTFYCGGGGNGGGGGGGDGFFLAREDLGRMFDSSFPACAFFFFSSFFFKVEISLSTLISLFKPRLVHSGSASLDDCD